LKYFMWILENQCVCVYHDLFRWIIIAHSPIKSQCHSTMGSRKKRIARQLTDVCYPVRCRTDAALYQQEALKSEKLNYVRPHTVFLVIICQKYIGS
jgi:hypothetical protein